MVTRLVPGLNPFQPSPPNHGTCSQPSRGRASPKATAADCGTHHFTSSATNGRRATLSSFTSAVRNWVTACFRSWIDMSPIPLGEPLGGGLFSVPRRRPYHRASGRLAALEGFELGGDIGELDLPADHG